MSSEGDVIAGHKSIQEVIELQADLSEMFVWHKNIVDKSLILFCYHRECQQLLDQCMAQQKSFEAQLELNRLKQERRLVHIVHVCEQDAS